MAQADFTVLDDSLSVGVVRRGVTSGIARPNGGGSFLYGFNSAANTAGAVGLYNNQTNFAPTDKGGSVRCAIQRGASGGPLNFTPLIFCSAAGNSVLQSAYLLGLEDDDPHHIVLRKGKIAEGLPAVSLGTQGVLRKSSSSFAVGTWLHLRLDVIANDNGDVILQVFRNDLDLHTVGSPTWAPVPGMDDFVDDALGINSGSLPLVGGYSGFAFACKDVTRRGYFDHFQSLRQT